MIPTAAAEQAKVLTHDEPAPESCRVSVGSFPRGHRVSCRSAIKPDVARDSWGDQGTPGPRGRHRARRDCRRTTVTTVKRRPDPWESRPCILNRLLPGRARTPTPTPVALADLRRTPWGTPTVHESSMVNDGPCVDEQGETTDDAILPRIRCCPSSLSPLSLCHSGVPGGKCSRRTAMGSPDAPKGGSCIGHRCPDEEMCRRAIIVMPPHGTIRSSRGDHSQGNGDRGDSSNKSPKVSLYHRSQGWGVEMHAMAEPPTPAVRPRAPIPSCPRVRP